VAGRTWLAIYIGYPLAATRARYTHAVSTFTHPAYHHWQNPAAGVSPPITVATIGFGLDRERLEIYCCPERSPNGRPFLIKTSGSTKFDGLPFGKRATTPGCRSADRPKRHCCRQARASSGLSKWSQAPILTPFGGFQSRSFGNYTMTRIEAPTAAAACSGITLPSTWRCPLLIPSYVSSKSG
jgi:hypothetical protein